MHQLSFSNNCDQAVWVNVQGGPPGICDNNFESDGTTHVKCSACSTCGDGSLCNTSVSTGDPLPLCCPLITDPPRCWGGEQCSKTGCCPTIAQTAMETYPCPGITSTAVCGNTSMNYTQVANLSGYNNPASGFQRANCSGSVIGGGGFKLDVNSMQTFNVDDGWQGAWFGRTNCTFNANGEGDCETGDCLASGWGYLQCSGVGSSPPVTKGEMNLEITSGIDYYDVSLVDGFNLPMEIKPMNYNPAYVAALPSDLFRCTASGCTNTSTLSSCPTSLKFIPNSKLVACQDDCNLATILHNTNPAMYPDAVVKAYCCPDTEYCSPINKCGIGSTCKAWLSDPGNCKNCSAYDGIYPNGYPTTTDLFNSAIFFHQSCPNAYSFTYDDASASYTCNSTPSTGLRTKYNISFCAAITPAPTTPIPTPTLTPTLTPAPANGGSDTGGGSGSSGSPVASAPATNAGGTLSLSFNQQPSATTPVGVSQVQISTGKETESFAVTAQPVSLGDAMQVHGQPVAGYLEISPVGVPPGAITSGTITFVVNPSWLSSHNVAPADIVLMRYHDNQWGALPTTFIGQSGTSYNFQSVTPGFSYFAITATTQNNTTIPATLPVIPVTSNQVSNPAVITDSVTRLPVTNAPVTTETTVPPVTPAPVSAFPLTAIIAVIGAGVIIIGGAVLIRRWWIRRQNPALFKDLD